MIVSKHLIFQQVITKKYLCRDSIRGIRFQWSSDPGKAYMFSSLDEFAKAIEDNDYEMAQLRGMMFYVVERTLLTVPK
jgi:hypothetical protein